MGDECGMCGEYHGILDRCPTRISKPMKRKTVNIFENNVSAKRSAVRSTDGLDVLRYAIINTNDNSWEYEAATKSECMKMLPVFRKPGESYCLIAVVKEDI